MAVGSNTFTAVGCQEILHDNSNNNTILVPVTLSLSRSLCQIKSHLSSVYLCVYQGIKIKFKIFSCLP